MPDQISNVLERVFESADPSAADLEFLLNLEEHGEQELIFEFADDVRRRYVGDGIMVRGIVEFSNFCDNPCPYCGLNKNNKQVKRYRLSDEEILESVSKIAACGIKTLVLQSGEEKNLEVGRLKQIIAAVKNDYDLAVTLMVGERTCQDYGIWKQAGADRYLLKIETSSKELYDSLHGKMSFDNRIKCLNDLKELGYQTGTGNIVGLKSQTISQLAQDIRFFNRWNFDMISVSPFIPHPGTPLGNEQRADVGLTLKVLALSRIVCKDAHMPATTALECFGSDVRKKAFRCGANVIMPNFTPDTVKKLYEIYPGKRSIGDKQNVIESLKQFAAELPGRFIDTSRGDSLKK